MNSLLRESLGILQLLAIRGGGLLALFLVNILIARNYGAATLGLFQLAMATVLIGSTVGRIGQDQLILRVAAEAKATKTPLLAQEYLFAGLTLATGALSLCTMAIMLFLYLFAQQPDISLEHTFLILMALGIVPTGLLFILTEALRGWQYVNLAIIWQSSVPQILTLVILLFVQSTSYNGVFWIPVSYVASVFLAFTCAFYTWQKVTNFTLTWSTFLSIKKVVVGGLHFWLYAVLTVAIAWIDVILLQAISDATAVGTYSAIVRTGSILGTIVQIISAGAVAKLALYYAQEDFAKFANCFRKYFQIIAITGLPITILIFSFPVEIMKIWGNDYAGSHSAFEIYAFFQVLNYCLSLAALSVVVIREEKQLVTVQFISVFFKIALIYFGFKLHGTIGALWGAGLSLLIFNILMCFVFFRKLRSRGVQLKQLIYSK